jgi:hypothetical protein
MSLGKPRNSLSKEPYYYYRAHNSPPLGPVLTQIHPVHILIPYFLRSILILSSYLHVDLPSVFFPSRFTSFILSTNNNIWPRTQIIKLLIIRDTLFSLVKYNYNVNVPETTTENM